MGSFRLAPEWARQDAVILVWPHSQSDWANPNDEQQLRTIEKTYIEMSRYISRSQKLVLVVYDTSHKKHVQNQLILNSVSQNNIVYVEIVTNDTWVRDYGPIFVYTEDDTDAYPKSENTLLNFTFDAWGNKYSHEHDNLFNKHLIKQLSITSPNVEINLVLEGGNLEINSRGDLLCSSTCFKRKSNTQIQELTVLERDFKNWFCADMHWIHDVALQGDDTDGHIDTLARYCEDDIILYSSLGNKSDPNNKALHSLADQLKQMNVNNTEFIPLPLPQPIFHNNRQLPATYTNFLITNKYVLVPVFNDNQDNNTLKTLDDLFPSREIIDIESTALIQQYGGIHCASMQIPTSFS